MADSAARKLRLFGGSLALAVKAEHAEAHSCVQKFRNLGSQVRERLESHANVKVIQGLGKDPSDFVFRFPRMWAPHGPDNNLAVGYWVFPEFRSPMIFQFHLPRKLQNATLAGAGENHGVEDFWVVYDGMLFLGAYDSQAEDVGSWIPPMVRRYLQTELLKTVGECNAIVIPPSPMHVEIELAEVASGPPGIDWNYQQRLLTVRGYPLKEMATDVIVEAFFQRMHKTLHRFYHLEIDKSIADGLLRDILNDATAAYRDYEKSLDIPFWKLLPKWEIQRGLSRKIGRIQYLFCEHALALTTVREAQVGLYRELDTNLLMSKSGEYFRSASEPESLNYDLFKGSLEHIRSHVFVLSQNKYLIYAALAGSFITVLATVLGYFIHR